MKFEFKTDLEANRYCIDIVSEMTKIFDILEEESIKRINQVWKGQNINGDEDVIYHELPEHWAKEICYDHDSK